jgi:hypothetical protein
MKKFKVIASSITYYKIEIEAETEGEAWQLAKDADGGDFKEIGLGDWDICDISELSEAP